MPDLKTMPVAMPPFDYVPRSYSGPSRDEVFALRRKFVNPAVFTLYRQPIMIVEGKMQYLFDETGRRYLDLLGGIVTVSVGHCHPRVLQAIKEQLETLQHASRVIGDWISFYNTRRPHQALAMKTPAEAYALAA